MEKTSEILISIIKQFTKNKTKCQLLAHIIIENPFQKVYNKRKKAPLQCRKSAYFIDSFMIIL